MNDQNVMLRTVHHYLQQRQLDGWLVGGSVRDQLLKVPCGDLDIAVDGDVLALGQEIADATMGRYIILDAEHPTARVVWRGSDPRKLPVTVDLIQLRAATVDEDLRLRDFTINAMAVPLGVSEWQITDVLDPTGGIDDLKQGIIRACGPRSLTDDPLRMLRAVRLGAQFGFQLAAELRAELQARHRQITTVANERIRDELLRLLALPHAAYWLREMDSVGLLTAIIPELEPARSCGQPGGHHYLPVLEHMLEAVRVWEWIEAVHVYPDCMEPVDPPLAVTAHPELTVDLASLEAIAVRMGAVVDGVPRRALFKLALMMHDIAKPQTKAIKPDGSASFYDHQVIGAEIAREVVRRLRVSKAGCEYVQTVVYNHMRPGQLAELGIQLSRRAIYRFFAAAGDAGPDVLVHLLCDYMAMRGPNLEPEHWYTTIEWVNHMLHHFYNEPEMVRPERLVDGRDLMVALSLPPGPKIGKILALLLEAQASGEVGTRDEALALARRLSSSDANSPNERTPVGQSEG